MDKLFLATLSWQQMSNSPLRTLSNIKFFRHNLNHVAFNGYLNTNIPSNDTARQAFLKEGPVGLLPIKNKTNKINFVWSVNKEFAKKFNLKEKILNFLIHQLNQFYKKHNIIFSNNIISKIYSKTYNWPLELIYVPTPINNRIVLIGDAAHAIHPLSRSRF